MYVAGLAVMIQSTVSKLGNITTQLLWRIKLKKTRLGINSQIWLNAKNATNNNSACRLIYFLVCHFIFNQQMEAFFCFLMVNISVVTSFQSDVAFLWCCVRHWNQAAVPTAELVMHPRKIQVQRKVILLHF